MNYFIFIFSVAFIFSGCATTAGIIIGQKRKKSAEIQSIESDTHIEITFRNLKTIEGINKKVHEKNLYLDVDGEEREIPGIDIKQIEIPDLNWRWICIGTGYIVDRTIFYYLVLRSLQGMKK